jgi:hypothetical protein
LCELFQSMKCAKWFAISHPMEWACAWNWPGP